MKKGNSSRGRKGGANPVQIWQEAVLGLYRQLWDQLRTAGPDKLRLQNDCLFEMLQKTIRASGYEFNVTLLFCYLAAVVRDALEVPEPKRLYWEEVYALDTAEDAGWLASRDATALLEHTRMFCSWFEAECSLGEWLSFKHGGAEWKAESKDEWWRACQARMLAELPMRLIEYKFKGRTRRGARLREAEGIGADMDERAWNPRQWANILKRAARLAERDTKKGADECSLLEQWVWWSYPVFSRYKWTARQVIDAACKRDFNEPLLDKTPSEFARYFIARGLRFAGGKQLREKPPQLEQFVIDLALPDPGNMRSGIPVWRV